MTWRVFKCLLSLCFLTIGSGCSTTRQHTEADRVTAAERFFRGMYGCEPSVIDELAGEDIVVSYPIFQTLFQTPVVRGREAVKAFAARFCSKWADAQISIEDSVVEGNRVVLVWSFRARNVGSIRPGEPPTNREHSWGGITLIRFNSAGKIVAEIGEESEPGPAARMRPPL